jgi:hypothetical protein
MFHITQKGRKFIGTASGHVDRILKSLNDSPKEFGELLPIVRRHSHSEEPERILSWYLTQCSNINLIVRKETL